MRLRGSDRPAGGPARPNGRERIVELPEDREGRAEAGQIQDLMDLRVRPIGQQERKPERRSLGAVAPNEEDAQRRRVDERGVAQVDDDPPALVEQDGELVLEPLSGVGVVLPDEGDHGSRWIPPS